MLNLRFRVKPGMTYENMKQKTILIAALTGLLLAGCQTDELISEIERPTTGPWNLTVEASKEIPGQTRIDGATKALELSGSTLNAYWIDNEQVSVYQGGTYKGMLTATATGEKSPQATLSGSIEGLSKGDPITLLFPRKDWDYTGQDGAAPSPTGDLSTKYDYATADVTIQSVSGNNITTSGATFENQQSIFRFGFKKGDSNYSVKAFTLASSKGKLVQSRTYESSNWTSTYGLLSVVPTSTPTDKLYYMAIRNENTTEADKFSFYVIGDDNGLYTGSKDIPTSALVNGQFFNAAVSITLANFAAASGSISSASDIF